MADRPDVAQFGRYARAVSHLRPAQLAHHVRLRAQRAALARRPDDLARRWQHEPAGPVGLPATFTALDALHPPGCGPLEDIRTATFTFLGERRALGAADGSIRWDPDDASQLWLFHHHYWDWAWTLAATGDPDAHAVFARQWRSWRAGTRFGRWNAWAAYPASLRAWAVVNTFDRLAAGTDVEDEVVADMGLHAGFLARNLELNLGGNHLVKNLKAMIGLGVFLSDDRIVADHVARLVDEIAVQVLADGGHYELSPGYHCQVLGDLIDVEGLLRADGRDVPHQLTAALEAMRRWLGAMRMPDGGLPQFNDNDVVDPERIDALSPVPSPDEPLLVLPHSGHVVMRRGPMHLVADVGQPGEPSLPGHIHADCLTFELSVHGERVVIDTGTSEYGSGPRRQFERSTRAHNTIEIDATNQTEVWGAFRAGRMARATLERAEITSDAVEVTASHDGYRALPGSPTHRRTWTVTDETVTLTDTVTGRGRHQLTAGLLFPAEQIAADGAPELVAVDAHGSDGTAVEWSDTTRADGFGNLAPARRWSLTTSTALPAVVTTTIRARAAYRQPPPSL